ncbi:MAG TPA: tetratricopeptide repeat protein [Candidatus Angelobacter sp.]|nr:tetratricopeptide repeat protein [Candidatus Angelobacter sp.]
MNDYSHILKADPENINANACRGQVLAEMGDFQAALNDLNKGLQLIQSFAKLDSNGDSNALDQEAFIRRGRADALAGLGDTASTLAELEQSLQICPENAWAWYSRACVYEKMGNHEKAAADYQTSLLKTGPQLTPARRERARTWLQNHR